MHVYIGMYTYICVYDISQLWLCYASFRGFKMFTLLLYIQLLLYVSQHFQTLWGPQSELQLHTLCYTREELRHCPWPPRLQRKATETFIAAASFGSQVSAAAPSLITSVSLVQKYESFSSTAEALVMSSYTFPLSYGNVILCFQCICLSEWNIHSFLRNE